MNIEGLTLKLLTDTLNEELLGSKIYKVYMPNPQSLLLLVRRTRDTSSLLADMHNGSCVLYLPQQLLPAEGALAAAVLLSGLLCSVLPVWLLSRRDVADAL